MINVIRRVWETLRLTLYGADPAPPSRPMRETFAAVWVIVLVGFAAINVQYLCDSRTMPMMIAIPITGVTMLPLLFVRDKPLWAWRIGLIAMFVGAIDYEGGQAGPWSVIQIFVTVIVLFYVALREPVGVILWAGFLTSAAVWVQVQSGNMIAMTLLVAAVLLFGEQIQRRRRVQRDLRVETERMKIARELHDVVAHSMSLVAVRAETAPYRLGELPDAAKREFDELAVTARESLTELRRLLGVMRTDDPAARAPQPTLSDVEELVRSVRKAGMNVSYVPQRIEVPPAIGLTVYRVVQEALSNAARHAPGAAVSVSVGRSAGSVVAAVRNPVTRAVGNPGHGLTGMRERVELLGGEVKHGLHNGVFEVEAVIPVD
jgi:signal transduction histidine kinase